MSVTTTVLVHGAWHGPWAWDHLVERLERAGQQVATVDLPSSGPDAATRGDLAADVAAVRQVLEQVDGPAVLVGHSYGGVPITQVGDVDGRVRHLVYLAAFMLDEGESLAGSLGGELPDWIEVIEDGAATLPRRPTEVFYADVEPDLAADAAARLAPQSTKSFTDALTAAGWHDLPSSYILTEQDNALPPAAQEQMSQRAGAVRRIATSHSPFLSQPDVIADLLTSVAAASD